MSNAELETLHQLNAAVLIDVLDSRGLMQQAMKPFMRPLDDTLQLIGRARAGLYMPVYAHRAGENPYEVEIALVDDLKPGDVVVLACTKGRARMVERDVPVQCAGVDVRPGDLVFGDVDGVVVIPREHEAAVVTRAMEKVAGENQSRDALRRGELLGDVFRRLGIL